MDEWAENTYKAIRASGTSDVGIVARNAGLTVEEVTTLKKHIFFGKHRLTEDGKNFIRARFTADQEIAYVWQLAQRGELTQTQKEWVGEYVAHELAERKFMGQGMPYRDPDSFVEGVSFGSPPGAHDLAPPPPRFGTFPGFEEWADGNLFK